MNISKDISHIQQTLPLEHVYKGAQVDKSKIDGGHKWTIGTRGTNTIDKCSKNNLETLNKAKPNQETLTRKTEWLKAEPMQKGETRKAGSVSIGKINGGKMDFYLKAQTEGMTPKQGAEKILSLWNSPSKTDKLNAYKFLDKSDNALAIVKEMYAKDPEAFCEFTKFGLSVEIQNNRIESELLRGEPIVVKMMGLIMNDTFNPALKEVFGGGEYAKIPPIIVDKPADGNDPESLKSPQSIAEGQLPVLERAVENVVSQSITMLKDTPRGKGHELLEHLRDAVEEKYPGKGEKHVVTNFILRSLNPFLTTNTQFSREERRNATTITKVIQNMANGIEFGNKESYMIPCNGCLKNIAHYRNDLLQQLTPTNKTPQ